MRTLLVRASVVAMATALVLLVVVRGASASSLAGQARSVAARELIELYQGNAHACTLQTRRLQIATARIAAELLRRPIADCAQAIQDQYRYNRAHFDTAKVLAGAKADARAIYRAPVRLSDHDTRATIRVRARFRSGGVATTVTFTDGLVRQHGSWLIDDES